MCSIQKNSYYSTNLEGWKLVKSYRRKYTSCKRDVDSISIKDNKWKIIFQCAEEVLIRIICATKNMPRTVLVNVKILLNSSETRYYQRKFTEARKYWKLSFSNPLSKDDPVLAEKEICVVEFKFYDKIAPKETLEKRKLEIEAICSPKKKKETNVMAEEKTKIVAPQFTLTDLSRNMEQLIKEEYFFDVTIHCGNEVFKLYKGILSCRSPFFANLFKGHVEGKVYINDIEPKVFHVVLFYIYTGRYHKKYHSIEMAHCIIDAAEKYMLPDLKLLCIEELRSSLSKSNALDILIIADMHDIKFKKQIMPFVCFNYRSFKNSIQWQGLQERNPSLAIEIMDEKIKMMEQ